MSEERLPEDWVLKKIGDVCSIMGGGTPSRQVSDYFGGSIVWLTPTEINKKNIHVISTSREYITTEGYKNSSARIIPTGSVLLTSRASIGYVAIAGCDLTTNQGFAAFTPLAELHNLYLAYWLKSQKKNLEDKATGTTFKEIAKAVLKTLELPLPPLPVQQQIVAKIEELFSELDAGVQELKTALFRLKVYRQAVLQNKLSNKNWPTIQLDGLLQPGRNSIKTGPFGMALGKTDHRASGIPVLGIENIGRGKFWDRNKIFITADKAAELSSYTVSEGDLIISRSGTVGEICMVPSKMQGSLISTNLIKLSLNKNIIDSQYFCYLFLGCQSVLNAVKEQCKGSTRDFLNQGILKALDFPLPDLPTQIQIVAEIEERLSEADAMEITIRQELARAENLRQSILKQAFEGKLVASTISLDQTEPEELSEDSKSVLSNYGGKAEQLTLF